MFLLVGLGNPGKRFAQTRHNVGFRVLERFAEDFHLRWKQEDLVEWTTWIWEDQPIYLLKPLTFMNRSGEGLRFFLTRHRFSAPELVVVHDDLDFPPGVVRIRKGGGTGGHRGVESIIATWGNPDFIRVRVGIGRPPLKEEVVEYVLGVPEGEEVRILI
ncbi:MAG: aminoacyl-tRNA hydrolase, partial [Candidatus Atribacteria bacterium]|nr:aminoacyl-tRNA hydrolase [Candidatus Atribacteria bacterium]